MVVWLLLIPGALLAGYACLLGFNLWTTKRLQRLYGYTWAQIHAHMMLREILTKAGIWETALGPYMVKYIKGMREENLVMLRAGLSEPRTELGRFSCYLAALPPDMSTRDALAQPR